MALQTITKAQQQEATRALELAYKTGVIRPLTVLPEVFHWRPPTVSDKDKRALLSMPLPPRRCDRLVDQLDEPARDTRAQVYQDVSYFHTPPPQAGFLNGNSYELARFVTKAEAGFVRLIWTYAEIEIEGDVVVIEWQDPFALQRFLPDVTVTWFLRLEQGIFQKHFPVQFAGPTAQVFGNGYSKLPEWADYRFMWGRTATNVFFLVPQNHALRLYARIDGANADLRALGGRLQGYTQSIDVKATGFNVTHGW
jgi:hypothetical protein